MSTVADVEVPDSVPATGDWVLALPIDGGRAALTSATFAERGHLQVFFDGYLFEQDDLARAHGVDVRASAADIILSAYERAGEALFSRLRGSFVIAVVDRSRATATVVRDPLGSHPLFYAEARSSILFAALPATLLERPGVSSSLNRPVLADHLLRRWPDPHETFFEGVQRVPPGWRIVVRGGQVTRERYWDPVPHGQRIEWLTAQEIDRFDEHLDRAVARCLSQGRAGIFLSGGFDSVSIAAVAAEHCRKNGTEAPWALSLAFPGAADERAVQTGVASSLNLPTYLAEFADAAGPNGLLNAGVALNSGLSAPLFNSWAPAYFHLARHAKAQGVRTILTGSGGDEWLGVSPYLAADLLRRGDLAGLTRFVRTWSRSYHHTWGQVLRGSLWTFCMRPLASMALEKIAPGPWKDSRLKRLHAAEPAWTVPDPGLRAAVRERARAAFPSADPPGGFYARDSRTTLDHTLMSCDLEEQYQFGRALGINYMHPYWDPDLGAQIYRTPPEILMKGGRAKGLVRETVARRFPGLGFERQRKVSAQEVFRQVLVKELPALAASVGDFRALSALGLVDNKGARVWVDEALREMKHPAFLAYYLLVQELWTRKYVN